MHLIEKTTSKVVAETKAVNYILYRQYKKKKRERGGGRLTRESTSYDLCIALCPLSLLSHFLLSATSFLSYHPFISHPPSFFTSIFCWHRLFLSPSLVPFVIFSLPNVTLLSMTPPRAISKSLSLSLSFPCLINVTPMGAQTADDDDQSLFSRTDRL